MKVERRTPDIDLGDIAKDTITGYQGTVVARTEWLNGCWRITLQAGLDKEGKPHDGFSFDDQQCVLVEKRNHVAEKTTGGPHPTLRETGV